MITPAVRAFPLLWLAAAGAALAACGSSPAPSGAPQTTHTTATPSATASASTSPSPSGPPQQITLQPGISFDLPAGWSVEKSSGPVYLLSADKLTRVLITLGVYTGDGPRPSSGPQELSNMVKLVPRPAPEGPPASVGLQLANLQTQAVATSSAGPWDQVAEETYTATVNGQPVHGVLKEMLSSATGVSVFLQSISTPEVNFSNGFNSIVASLAAQSHPTG